MTRVAPQALFWGALALGLGLRLWILSLPAEAALSRWGSDDMFYYSQIAGRFATTGWLSFDGLHPGSGVQPLFFLLLLPFGPWILNDPASSTAVIFALVTALNLGTAVLLQRCLVALGAGALMASLGAALFLVHPKLLSVCFQGTEAALSALMLVASLWAWRALVGGRCSVWRASGVFALTVLTRFDFAVLLAAAALWSLAARELSPKVLGTALLGPVAALAAWAMLLWGQTGSPWPVSGQAKRLFVAALREAGAPGLVEQAVAALRTVLAAETSLSVGTALGLTLAAFRLRRVPVWAFGALCAVALHLAVLLWALHFFREWYLVPLFLALIFCLAGALAALRRAALPGFCVLCALWWGQAALHPRTHLTPAYFDAVEAAVSALPKGARLGVFNAGLPGALAGDRLRVINLDGVVNGAAVTAYRAGDIAGYLGAAGVSHLLDYPGSIAFHLAQGGAADLPLHLEQRFELPGTGPGAIVLMRVGP